MRHLRVLHVEENKDDANLLVQACKAAGLPAEFSRVGSGLDAVAYLQGRGDFADRVRCPLPDVIVLDMDSDEEGIEFLRWLRREPKFASSPVLVFTACGKEEDRARVMGEGATGYFVKPKAGETLTRLAELLRRLDGGNSDYIEPLT